MASRQRSPDARLTRGGTGPVLVAQLGARRHYAVPRALERIGLLERFFTDSYVGNKPWLVPLVKAAIRFSDSDRARRYLARAATDIPAHKVESFESLGLRQVASLARHRRSTRMPVEIYSDFGRRFGEQVAAAGFGDAGVVYGFNGASLELFQAAKAHGIKCVLDQTIIPRNLYRHIMQIEAERWPGWQPDLNIPRSDDELAERDRQEWALADMTVCGSSFLAQTLRESGEVNGRCHVIPYGFEVPVHMRRRQPGTRRRPGPLRLLFAGEIGLRKGAPYFLEAIAAAPRGSVAARLVGSVHLAPECLAPYAGLIDVRGPVPRSGMPEHFEWADALVLPSLCEGSAMVTVEACQLGIPVICTPNAGSDVTHGVDGLIVEPRSVEALVEAFELLPALIERRADEASSERPASGSFDVYCSRLGAAIASLFAEPVVAPRQQPVLIEGDAA